MIAPRLTPRPVYGSAPAAIPIKFSPRSDARLAEVDPNLAELMRRVEAAHPDAFEIAEVFPLPPMLSVMTAEPSSLTTIAPVE